MIHFLMLLNRQGKTRLAKWYSPFTQKEKTRFSREIGNMILNRPQKLCNFLEWKSYKIIFKRYASLFFIVCADPTDNELLMLEIIHLFVETLDRHFVNVCELDLIFNFHKAYFILDELLMSGELQETSEKVILRIIEQQDRLQENVVEGNFAKIEI
eukprot:TRINITY_DN3394_c0_g1_i2.p1 TRINITY_DN3394_c0_g1~~TRINITY_DN3394_c0_g1_i2.p1  ORF type:complete len:156 (-),score=11.75 TRINITY_DN3394_c0_g1_i2:13-480(-)